MYENVGIFCTMLLNTRQQPIIFHFKCSVYILFTLVPVSWLLVVGVCDRLGRVHWGPRKQNSLT